MHPFSCIVVLSFLFGTTVTKERNMFQFGQCELSGVSFQELRDHFGEIKETVQTQDNRTDVILLKESVLLQTSVSESCCLLRHLLRFYIESVFKHYEATSNLLRRKTSTLANTFLSIKASLRQCLDRNIAAIKAVGEMDILFAWMRDINN
ncbi:interleukin-20-like [Eublepharis macularius]|uniref:Interleukin family protein n=1 Tax=Eublepharis macularius TaxID=481883 RepID=A0AA97KZA8_EUBMA|nr:interleukin-20-like [Eublepharis macularius]